ncbi:MAG: glutamate formimidoyltransferase [Tannerellaceae bacterium]|jgi:glutamate formiminotransferase|nr:glutamate formimidoyltransferase [Tannerellaceae bacterium]
MNKDKPIIETVPNFSEGRDTTVIERITDAFRGQVGVKLLDYSSDRDHNRMVVTAAGEPHAITDAIIRATGVAIDLIDMNVHRGVHPRMGAVDVIPFVPVRGCTADDAVMLSREAGIRIADTYGLPVFLYEQSATSPHRRNLADVRRGEFEGLGDKMEDAAWQPDFGPSHPHPTAGAVAVGGRAPLIAYNVNLATDRIEIARAIARKLRHSSGGLRGCKAMGVRIDGGRAVQVSMNMTDYANTSLYMAFEMVKVEARRYGVSVSGSEIVGLAPLAAIVDTAAYYLGLESFTERSILEARLAE